MSSRRTAALAVGVAILIGGGATAFAAANDSPSRPGLETAISAAETRGTDSATAGEAASSADPAGAETTSAELDVVAGSDPADTTTEPGPSTTASSTSDRSDDGAAGISDRLAGPSAAFGTMSTVPPDWNGFDDSDSNSPDHIPGDGPYDGPGLPFDINNISLDSLISLARSVGIEVGVPVFGDDGSIKVAVTLPDGSEHTVWVAIDGDHHITDATVDGTPVMEFVRQFLAGEVGRPSPPVEPHPEWNLLD